MAPLPEIFMSLVYNLITYESSSAVNASEKLAQTASGSPNFTGIWAWFLGIFASFGSFFTSAWQSVDIVAPVKDVGEWLSHSWHEFSEFLLQPQVRNVLIVWFVVFWICLFIPLLLGFGPAGVIAGSIAAGFQSAVYGAFTPAGGIFAVLTSVGMLGIACPPAVILAVVVASVAAGLAWSIVAPA